MKRTMKLFEVIGVLGLVVMLCITFASILSRYVLPVSWAFTEELVCGIFILVSLLGAALAVIDGKAMGISLITDLFPQKQQKYFCIIEGVATFIFSSILVVYGIEMVKSELKVNMRTAALNWPEAIFGSFVPIGGLALAVASIFFIYKSVKASPKKKDGEA